MSESSTLFRFLPEPGPCAVGLRVVAQYDYSRVFKSSTDECGKPFAGERARPLQTLVWYPAKPEQRATLMVRDYTDMWATETSFDTPRLPMRAREWIGAMDPALDLPMRALRDAPEASGTFPLVIYAPSFSSVSWENADLCEYLASHGFVVLATPSLGATTRHMTPDLEGLDAQARDISFLIGYARALPNADLSRVAVAGFSWGGLANVFAAAQDTRIRALLALDGSIRYWPGLVRRAANVRPERMTIPLISFAKADWTLEEQSRYLTPEQLDGPNVLNAWQHGDLFGVHMLGMTHRQFSSMFQRNEDVWKDFHDPRFPDRQKADYGREHGAAAYGWVARYALQFLNACLKEEAGALEYLWNSPSSNGVPRNFMEVSHRRGTGIAPSMEALRTEVGRRGLDHLGEIHAEMTRHPSEVNLDESALEGWAEELIDADRLAEAIRILAFNVELRPQSSSARASLARAQLLSGNRDEAIAGYRTALHKYPINAEAMRRLRALAGQSGK